MHTLAREPFYFVEEQLALSLEQVHALPVLLAIALQP
jgi:hypothetical protein